MTSFIGALHIYTFIKLLSLSAIATPYLACFACVHHTQKGGYDLHFHGFFEEFDLF